jgi:signal transduction histidine kinase
MHFQGYLLIAIGLINTIQGCVVLLRNNRNAKNITFASLSISAALWSFGLAGFILTEPADQALLWARGYYLAAAAIAFFFVLFSLHFTDNWHRPTTRDYLIGIFPLTIFLLLAFGPNSWLLTRVVYHEWGKEVILNKNGYLFYASYFLTYAVLGFSVIYRSMVKARGLFKVYLSFLFYSLMMAFASGTAFNLIYPAFGNYRYIWVGPMFTLIYIAVIAYAIIRHKLFDMRIIAARSVAYLLLLGSLAAFFTVALLALTNLLFNHETVSRGVKFSYVLIALFIAILFQPIKKVFDKASNAIFYRDAYEPQAFIDQLNRVIVGNIRLQPLVDSVIEIINQNMKTQYCLFILDDGKNIRTFSGQDELHFDGLTLESLAVATKRKGVMLVDYIEGAELEVQDVMSRNDVGAVINVPMQLGDGSEDYKVYMVLGIKKSGNPFTKDDARTLNIIANTISIAIENAMHFDQISKFNVTLQQKIEAATLELRSANERLRDLDEAKDEFISMASHQLRTPLTVIKGYISLILDGMMGQVNDKQRDALQNAMDGAQRMNFVIGDLLNVSRLQTGKFQIENQPTKLDKVVESEIEQLQRAAKNHNLTLEYKKPDKFPILVLDETKIRQVIMNFIDNAIYYTPPGGKITVALNHDDKQANFTVTDTGLGVPPAERSHLFSKFYRAGNARKMRPDGTGLGLYMAKKVIDAQGGAILFHSIEGKGSTFGFVLPRTPSLQGRQSS